jgi:hypothetical protein
MKDWKSRDSVAAMLGLVVAHGCCVMPDADANQEVGVDTPSNNVWGLCASSRRPNRGTQDEDASL